jgi:hypothetical protein
MSFIYSTYTWQPADLNAACALQNGVADTPLTMNGTLGNSVTNKANFVKNGSVRSVSLTSTNNLSAVNFLIKGVQNGVLVEEQIAGPNNNTVETTISFDEVDSITPSANAAGIRAGTGLTGYFPLIQVNTKVLTNILNYGIQVIRTSGTVTYNIQSTLVDNMIYNGASFSQFKEMQSYLGAQNESSISQESKIANYYMVQVTASEATTTLKLIYTQV